jgi:hypothetical protein
MDPHWDPSKSSTAGVLKCSATSSASSNKDIKSKHNKCFYSQSYSEGSSWHAFKVHDKLWMGGK